MILPLLFAVLPGLFSGKDTAGYTKVPPPGVRFRMNMATATRAPWIDSNIWRYRRKPKDNFLCDVKDKSVVVAMAEAFSQGAHVDLQISPGQKADFDAMTAFLKTIPDGPRKPWANITVTEDGSPLAGEALLLLTRRNMFYRVGPKDAGSALHLNFTAKSGNVYEQVLEARDKLGDEKRPVRIFGSEQTIADVMREGNKVRVFLINYGTRPVETLRVRVEGNYTPQQVKAYVFNGANAKLSEFERDGAFTEFTLEAFPSFAVLDLTDSR